jgi:acetoin utilization protein AcuB
VVEAERLVGIVTLTDLHKLIFPDEDAVELIDPTHLTVGDMMTPEPMTTSPDTPLEKVAVMMSRNKVSSLPVLEGSDLVGIITETDIFRAVVDLVGALSESTRMMVYLTVDDAFGDILESMVEHEVELLSLIRDSGREEADEVVTMRIQGGQVTDFVQTVRDSGVTVLSVE